MQQRRRLALLLGILLLLGIIAFSVFNSRQYFTGPQIIIEEPKTGAVFEDPFITFKGQAINTSFIRLNGHPIYVNEENIFEEKLLLSPGTSIMKLEATDRFGREISETIALTYTGEAVVPKTTIYQDQASSSDSF